MVGGEVTGIDKAKGETVGVLKWGWGKDYWGMEEMVDRTGYVVSRSCGMLKSPTRVTGIEIRREQVNQ